MTTHTCLRCGLESRCLHGFWPGRHPFAAVLFAVPVTIAGLGAIAAYPWLFVPLLVAAVAAYVADREHRRRQALAARADYEHQRLMARPLPPVNVPYARGTRSATVRPFRPRNPAPWHLVSPLPTEPVPTTPLRTGRN